MAVHPVHHPHPSYDDRRKSETFVFGSVQDDEKEEVKGWNELYMGQEAIVVLPETMMTGNITIAKGALVRYDVKVLTTTASGGGLRGSRSGSSKEAMPTETATADDTFDRIDADNDGRISQEEPLAYYHSIGYEDTMAIDEVMMYDDLDEDGYISIEEFHSLTSELNDDQDDVEEDDEYDYSKDIDDDDDFDADEYYYADSDDEEQDDEDDNTFADDYFYNESYSFEDDTIITTNDEEAGDDDDGFDMFHDIDTNKDNLITREELKAYFVAMGDNGADVDEIIRLEDTNGDGI